MSPLTIEVHCNLTETAPEWDDIASLSLEIGYPAFGGKTLWKHIGWLQEQAKSAGRNFAHALWNRQTHQQVLIFDFLPVWPPDEPEPEKSFRIRKSITTADGRQKSGKPLLLYGEYQDEHFSLHPQYPSLKEP